MTAQTQLFPPSLPSGFEHLAAFVTKDAQERLLDAVEDVAKAAPFRTPRTRSGAFSAEITNCGTVGWWSDANGYRYTATQPESDTPWPALPDSFAAVVTDALKAAGLGVFTPDACLINRYNAGAKMGLHQDKDEADFSYPIVTVCLGAAADFLIGGPKRSNKPDVVLVESGDVIVMGGDSRMRFHGIRKIYRGTSPLGGLDGRISLTFRKAL